MIYILTPKEIKMKIQKADEDCFFIELSEKDMAYYNIACKPEGLYTEKEESLFIHILKEHKEAFSFKKADISILPGIKGGCVAVVKKKNETSFPFYVFESESCDNFIDSAKILKKRNITVASSLYKGENCFRLITENKNEKAVFLLCEFSKRLRFSESEKTYTENYFDCIIKDNALEILSGK